MIKTIRCQTRLLFTTLLHQDARLEEDAANGALVRSQPASGKRKCAACSMCGTRFNHGEARLQQWGNRETNQHYAHAQCVNGGLGHDRELLPKQAGDQDAVDPVARQRETITRTAADTEYSCPLLRIQIKPQQLHPPMTRRTCLDVRRHFAWMKRF